MVQYWCKQDSKARTKVIRSPLFFDRAKSGERVYVFVNFGSEKPEMRSILNCAPYNFIPSRPSKMIEKIHAFHSPPYNSCAFIYDYAPFAHSSCLFCPQFQHPDLGWISRLRDQSSWILKMQHRVIRKILPLCPPPPKKKKKNRKNDKALHFSIPTPKQKTRDHVDNNDYDFWQRIQLW